MDKCYRVYVDNDVVATVFSSVQAVVEMNKWLSAGYKNVETKIENYQTKHNTEPQRLLWQKVETCILCGGKRI